jgi:hypothetical protein
MTSTRSVTRRGLAACGVLVLAALLPGCETAPRGPLVHSGKLSLDLTDEPIPSGVAPFASVRDGRSTGTLGRNNAPLGERYGDEDFAQPPIDALRAEIAYAAGMRLQSKRVLEELARCSFELQSFEVAYVAMPEDELKRLLAQEDVPVFKVLDHAMVAITGRQGSIILSATVVIDGKPVSARQLFRVAGEPPPGKHMLVPYMRRLGRELLAGIAP